MCGALPFAGPMPLFGELRHKGMIEHMTHLKDALPQQPKAILVVSAHWEARLAATKALLCERAHNA